MNEFELCTDLLEIIDQQKEIIEKQAGLISALAMKNMELENLIENL